jgi:predicted membrane-bound spermidine synthase
VNQSRTTSSVTRPFWKPRLFVTVFIAGMVSLALELAAARLLAPAFGTTELVWSAVIGLILLYFSAGYALGGRWADRSPYPTTLYTILVAAGLAIAVIPLIARPLLVVAARGMHGFNLPLIAGPFVIILLLFALPVTLLACVSPFALRLSVDDIARSGKVAGRLSATATLGSFIGALLPNLVLVPNLGTRRTFLLLALLALSMGLWGLWHAHRRRFWLLAWALLPVALLFVLNPGTVKPQANLIHERESTYNLIQVLEDLRGRRYLLLNEGQGVHSIYTPPEDYGEDGNPLAILTGGPWDYYLIAPFFNAPPYPPERVEDLLVIGLAAGTTPTQFAEVYGPLPVDGVEIDREIVEVGRRYFGMTQPQLEVHIADGRTYLLQSTQRYSIVAVDAYRLPYIPWHLTTVEFFQQVHDHLRGDGVVAINVGHTPSATAGAEGDWRLVDAISATMAQVFADVHVITIPGSFNAIVVATVQPTTPENLAANLPLLEDVRLRALTEQALAQLRTPAPSDLIFTDDRAPVEQLTHALVLRYVLGR